MIKKRRVRNVHSLLKLFRLSELSRLEDVQRRGSGAGICSASASSVHSVTHPSVGCPEFSAVLHHREGQRAGH